MNPGKLKEKIGDRDDCFFPDIPKCEIKNIKNRLQYYLVDIKNKNHKDEVGKVRYFEERELGEMFEEESPIYDDEVKTETKSERVAVDVVSLLSKYHRKTLTRYHNGRIETDEVSIENLKNKHIILCCFFVPCFWSQSSYSISIIRAVSLASHVLYGCQDFEVVVVVMMRNDWRNDFNAFNHFMSAFSCLAVPFSDSFTRHSICCSLNFGGSPYVLIVDKDHTISKNLFPDFGGADIVSFPRKPNTEQYLKLFCHQFTSLGEILHPCGFLYKNCHHRKGLEEKMVHISELENKLVGFFLLYNGLGFVQLEKVYNECRDQGLEFEIVILYLPYSSHMQPELYHPLCNQVFMKLNLSWWVLPFNDTVYRRLWRICNFDVEDMLIVMEPGGKAAYPFGQKIILNVGAKGYPFTAEGIIRRELERIQGLTLMSLLLPCQYVHRSNQDRVHVDELQGKNIIFYFSRLTKKHDKRVVDWFKKIKEKHADLEMILVPICSSPLLPPNMPWLTCPHYSWASIVQTYYLRLARMQSLAAFGKDGRICSISSCEHVKRFASPFIGDGDLRKGVISHLYDQGYDCMEDMS